MKNLTVDLKSMTGKLFQENEPFFATPTLILSFIDLRSFTAGGKTLFWKKGRENDEHIQRDPAGRLIPSDNLS